MTLSIYLTDVVARMPLSPWQVSRPSACERCDFSCSSQHDMAGLRTVRLGKDEVCSHRLGMP